jgi:hypothetical protein
MPPWEFAAGTLGVIVVNIILMDARIFLRTHGYSVGLLSRRFTRERGYLRELAHSDDAILASRAQGYLRLERIAWCLFALSVALFFSGALVLRKHELAGIAVQQNASEDALTQRASEH